MTSDLTLRRVGQRCINVLAMWVETETLFRKDKGKHGILLLIILIHGIILQRPWITAQSTSQPLLPYLRQNYLQLPWRNRSEPSLLAQGQLD